MSYGVLQRTSEIGLRMALGALPHRVLWMILRESLALVSVGVFFGLAGAFVVIRLISSQLFGVASTDPTSYTGASILFFVVAALACLLPARRAAQIDPIVALRAE